ncbi:hypothetical protein D3C87_197580 [compost metagenome]
MKKIFSTLSLLFVFGSIVAQSEYVTPPTIKEKAYTIDIKDIVATKEEFKFAFIIENKTSDKYLVFELSKIMIAFSDQDVYTPKNDEIIVVEPNDKVRRTVRIVGNADYRRDKIQIEFPKVMVNDKESDFASLTDLSTNAEQSVDVNGLGNLSVTGLAFKKDSWSGELVVKTNSFEGMLLMDITKITGKTAEGTLPIGFKRDKVGKVALVSNDKFKSKFSIADLGQKLSGIDLSKAFKLYTLSEIDVPQITVKKVGYVEPTASVNNNITLCPSHESINNLPVKIVVFNPNGICFKLAANGKTINPENSSNVTFDTEYGTTVLTLALSNGQTITDKIYPGEGHVYLAFELINRKGVYKLQRKFDLSGDARKATKTVETKLNNTALCKDKIWMDNDNSDILENVTVIRIAKDRVYYQDCNTNTETSISKNAILAVEYPNGYYDKFDFPSSTGKQNMDLVRNEADVIELRNSSRTTSSFIIGRTKR